MPNQVRVGVGVTGAKGAASDVDRLKDKFTNLQKQGAKGFAIGAGAAATTAALGLVGTAIHGVTNYLQDSAQAYRDDEVSQSKLRASLAANVQSYSGNTRAIEEVLAERIKLGFSDDEQRESLSSLLTRTHSYTKALELQRVAMDLARLRGISLAAASDLMGKAFSGQVGALRRAGIAVDAHATAEEALDAVMKATAGQAEAFANTVEGKLVVAQTRGEEASEKFGKSVAKLQSAVLPAATDAVEFFAQGLDAIQISADNAAPAVEKHAANVDALKFIFAGINPMFDQYLEKLDEEAAAELEAEDAATHHGDALAGVREASKNALAPTDDLTDGVDDLGDELDGSKPKLRTFQDNLDDIADAAKDANDEIDDLADTVQNELFGDAINAGNLAELRKTHDELLKDRDAAKKGSREYKILTGKIAENEKALFDLQLQMKEEEGPDAVIAWLKQQKLKFGDASGAIQRLIDKYRTLSGLVQKLGPLPTLRSGGAGTSGFQERAAGGPVSAGTPYLVGEEGPEVIVPGSSGTVVPNNKLGGSMGSSITVNVSVQAPSGSDGRRWGRAVGDSIAQTLREQDARLPVGVRA